MVFSSFLFTFYFLPLVVVIYYISKEKYRNYILVVASLLFYAYGEPRYVLLMLLSILVSYAIGSITAKLKDSGRLIAARNVLVTGLIINIGILFVFKYLHYTLRVIDSVLGLGIEIPDIRLPIGISFFTFQAMSYCIDVYRGRVSPQKNPLYVALYISFFPQLIAGPIVRYHSIEQQIKRRRTGLPDLADGIARFLLGFSKKVILANNLAVVADEVFAMDSMQCSTALLWMGSIAYSLEILFDFSGYSDMAIGLGRMFGFKIDENFNYPYISASITEFWRRWHISLGAWFRDYVYIPLGGSRVSVPRNILNLMIVWTLTGIWHGANVTFLVWGLFYFILLVIEKWVIKPQNPNVVKSIIWRIITLASVNFAWVMFNSVSIGHGIGYIKGMLGLHANSPGINLTEARLFHEYGFFIVAGLICCTPLVPRLIEIISGKLKGRAETAFKVSIALGYCLLFVWATSFLIMGSHNPFIYFNF